MHFTKFPFSTSKGIQILIGALLFFCAVEAGATEADANYELGAGDKIRIQVFGEDELSMDVLLSDSGQIDYPFLGKISAAGKTTNDLKRELMNGLKGDYLIQPKVMVSIIEFRQFYVNGEVQKPGGYAYQPGLTVDRAIALAGGFTVRAKKNDIVIRSSKLGDKVISVTLDHKVTPGDIVVVDTTFF